MRLFAGSRLNGVRAVRASVSKPLFLPLDDVAYDGERYVADFLATLGITGCLVIGIALAIAPASRASSGDADPTFSADGFALSSSAANGPGGTGIAVAPAPDGKIVVGVEVTRTLGCIEAWSCTYEFLPAVLRFNSDGSLDRSFAGDGELEPDSFPSGGDFADTELKDVAVQPDGKVVLVGHGHNRSASWVARLQADGTPDPSFGGGDGAAQVDLFGGSEYGSDQAGGVALTPNGRILIAGRSGAPAEQLFLARLLPDGSLDPSFSDDGWLAETDPRGFYRFVDLEGRSDGGIVLGGEPFGGGLQLFSYLPDGDRDPRIWGDGSALADHPAFAELSDMAVDPMGRVLVLGQRELIGRTPALIRLSTAGELDSTFGDGGIAVIDPPSFIGAPEFGGGVDLVAADRESRPLVAGGYVPTLVGRLTESGQLDPTFSRGGLSPVFLRRQDAVVRALVVTQDSVLIGGAASMGAMLARRHLGLGLPDADGDGVGDRSERCPLVFGSCPRYARRITIEYGKRRGRWEMRGRLKWRNYGCRTSPLLRLVRRRPGPDRVIARARSARVVRLKEQFGRGRFYATAKRTVLAYGVCPPSRSIVIRVRRSG